MARKYNQNMKDIINIHQLIITFHIPQSTFPLHLLPFNFLLGFGSQMRHKLSFDTKLGRYSLAYTMFWYTVYPSNIEPLTCARCLRKPFINFKCLSTIHMYLVCKGPHTSISSTWCMRQCSCALKNVEGRCFCISHMRRGISLLQYFISSLWISLDVNHLQVMQTNNDI